MEILIAPGSINVDLILRTDTVRGPKTFRGRFSQSQGGKGSNQALAARRASAGHSVKLVGAVGRDTWGDRARSVLRDSGVDITHVRCCDHHPTGVVMEYLYADGEVTIGLEPGANDAVTADDIEQTRPAIERAGILLTQIENPMASVERALSIAHNVSVPTVLDPSIVPDDEAQHRRLFDTLLPMVQCIAPNRSEAEQLTGIAVHDDATALQAARVLHQHVPLVLLTRGADGALVSRADKACFLRGHKVAAIDGGAAGDTFRGAFTLAVCEALGTRNNLASLTMEEVTEAARFGNAAAAICVTRSGACEAIPTRDEIEAQLRDNVEMEPAS